MEEYLARTLASGQAVTLQGLHRTWDGFFEEVARAGGARTLSGLEARLAVRVACTQGACAAFQTVAETRGFVSAAARFVADCERAGLCPSEVTRAAAKVSDLSGQRLQCLASIFTRFVQLTESRGASPGRRRSLATKMLLRAPRRPHVVVVRPRLPWDPADIAAVLALARSSSVRVELPYAPGKPAVYQGLEPVLAAFEAHPELEGLELVLEDPADAATGARRELMRALWSDTVAEAPIGELPPLTVLCAATPQAELRAIATHARRLVDAGAPPEAIAVASRAPGSLSRRLADELGRVGLELLDRRGPPLSSAPPAQLALALLALPQGGFSAEETLAVLSSRYLAGSPTLPPHRVARTVRGAGVRDLGAEGLERLEQLPDEDGRKVAEHVRRLLRPVLTLPDRAPLGEHAAALYLALEHLGVASRARSFEPGLAHASSALGAAIERAIARDQAAMDALEELLGGIGPAAQALGACEAVTRDSFARALFDLMAQTPLRAIGARGGAVRLVHLRDLAARTFDHVIVPRLLEGAAPARAVEDGLWGVGERQALNQALGCRAVAIFPDDDATAFENLMLVLALAGGRSSVLLSYPATDGERTTVRSPFLDEVLRVAPWTPVERLPPEPVPGLGTATSTGDLVARMALEVYADPAGRLPRRAPLLCPPEALLAALLRVMPDRVAHVAALAEMERERWTFFAGGAPGPYSGRVGPRSAFMKPGAGPQTPLAPGHLEDLANCPFTFLAGRLLGVRPVEEAGLAPDPRHVGQVAHACLEEFFRRRAQAGLMPLRGDADESSDLDAACAAVFAEAETRGRPGHPLLWELTRERIRADVVRWVAGEVAQGPPSGGIPARFEVEFGGRDSPAFALGGLYLRGRIDRIDRVGAGVMVIDYKLGGREREAQKLRPEVAGITRLQLPIYAAAARFALGASWADAAFASLKDGRATRSLGATLGQEATSRLLDTVLPARLAELGERIRGGRFDVKPVDCSGCNYRTVCRVVALTEDLE